MYAKPQIGKIKKIIEEKLEIVEFPDSEDELIVIRENQFAKSYNVEIGVGKCWRYPGYYDCVGFSYDDGRGVFGNGNVRVEKKLPKSVKVTTAKLKPGLLQSIQKASLGFTDDEWNGTLDSLITILEKYL